MRGVPIRAVELALVDQSFYKYCLSNLLFSALLFDFYFILIMLELIYKLIKEKNMDQNNSQPIQPDSLNPNPDQPNPNLNQPSNNNNFNQPMPANSVNSVPTDGQPSNPFSNQSNSASESPQYQPSIMNNAYNNNPQPIVQNSVNTVSSQPTMSPNDAVGEKSFLAAFILSLLLGWLGVDRFYLGKIGTGILKLITLGGFGIWYIIDLVLLLTNGVKDKKGYKLNDYHEHIKLAIILFVVWILLGLVINIILIATNKTMPNNDQMSSTSSSFSYTG